MRPASPRPGTRTWRRLWPRSTLPAGCWGRTRRRCRPSSSVAAPPPCCPRRTWFGCWAGSRSAFGLTADAEVTTEANPESVDAGVAGRAAGGRLHPDLVRHAVGRAARAGDPGSGALAGPGRCRRSRGAGRRVRPGQSRPDLRHPRGVAPRLAHRLEAALAPEPDHVSAYALIVEDGHPAGRRVRRGELPLPDDDDLADKYLLADETPVRRPASTGTRCPTGRPRSRPLPAQPAATGAATTGGASARARTATSAGSLVERQAPGRVRRPRWPPESHRPRRGRCSGGGPPAGTGAAGDPAGRGDARRSL